MSSRSTRRLILGSGLTGAGLVVLATAAVLALWPMKANGLTGNAVAPRYGPFGWYSTKPLPANPTTADFRSIGIRVPQDVVAARRHDAEVVAVVGVVVTATGLLVASKRRRPDALHGTETAN